MSKSIKRHNRHSMGNGKKTNRAKIFLALILLISAVIVVFTFKQKLRTSYVGISKDMFGTYDDVTEQNKNDNMEGIFINNYTESDKAYLEDIVKEPTRKK
jgi:hypothetical protein